MPSRLRIGYVGVGLMGLPMVKRLVSLQYAVRAYDVLAEKTAGAAAAGAQAAASPADAAQGGGLGDSALLQKLYPRMQRREFAPQSYVRQLLKDLDMVHEYAAALKAPTPMMSEALSLYRILVHLGHAELDTGAILKVYERKPA